MNNTTIPSRAAGVLLAVSSLPSPYGIGSLGKEARLWIDFLREAGQKYWQVLPLGPTGFGDSPYQSFSAFAGNPYFIDLDSLCDEGLLSRNEYSGIQWGRSAGRVSYEALFTHRETVLRTACRRFEGREELVEFHRANASWLDNYALFMAIKASQGQRSWVQWADGVRLRDEEWLDCMKRELHEDILYHVFVQYQFDKQWRELRRYANESGVAIIGDIPVYVSMDSADVWANRRLFQLDGNAMPAEVAGCPPDRFSGSGQLWGNPLYRWDVMERDGFSWWISRMKANLRLCDALRIDHFRGLESDYAIPYGEATVSGGRWLAGPGMALVSAIQGAVPGARIIAEDTGFLTDRVRALLLESGYPGMKVLQFAFDTREPGDYSPYGYGENSVVYTGTHDNNTIAGWVRDANQKDIAHAMEYTGSAGKRHLPRALIRLAMQSRARLAMIPMQDWLGLDGKARMNTPSTIGGNNWRWRLPKNALTPRLAREMRRMAELYGRMDRL